MKRSTFFKSLIALTPPSTVFKDLKFVQPDFVKDMIGKYNSEDFTWWLNEMGKSPEYQKQEFYWFERSNLEVVKGPIIKMKEHPVVITIRKDNHVS